MIAYDILKFIHVSAVVVWVGGIVALTVLNARLGRAGDRQTLAATARETAFYGRVIIGPSIGIVLLAGIAMVVIGHIPSHSAWIIWGLLGIVLFVLVGALFTGRTGAAISQLMTAERPDVARIAALQRRVSALTVLNVLVLFSTIWAMVFKPMF
jgi:uncharacterized membrane protein